MKTFESLFFTIVFFVVSFSLQAQKSDIKQQARIDTLHLPEPHLLRIGFTPSAIINEYVGLQFNGAINASDKFQFSLDAGWIFLTTLYNQAGARGYRVRPSVRFFLSKTSKYQLHFSVAYNFRKTRINRKERITYTGSNGPILTQFKQDITLKGIPYMLGLDIFARKNLIIDFGFGLGIGNLIVEDIGIPQGVRTSSSINADMDLPGDYRIPIVIFNIKIQYLIQ